MDLNLWIKQRTLRACCSVLVNLWKIKRIHHLHFSTALYSVIHNNNTAKCMLHFCSIYLLHLIFRWNPQFKKKTQVTCQDTFTKNTCIICPEDKKENYSALTSRKITLFISFVIWIKEQIKIWKMYANSVYTSWTW